MPRKKRKPFPKNATEYDRLVKLQQNHYRGTLEGYLSEEERAAIHEHNQKVFLQLRKEREERFRKFEDSGFDNEYVDEIEREEI